MISDTTSRDDVVADRPTDRVDAGRGRRRRRHRPMASGSRSARLARTRSAASAAPGAGGTLALGTSTTVIPAALPASTPLRESSTTSARCGRHAKAVAPPRGRRPAPACRARPRRTRRRPRTCRSARSPRARPRSPRRGPTRRWPPVWSPAIRATASTAPGMPGAPSWAYRATTPSTMARSISASGIARSRRSRMIRDQPRELAPITAA